MKILSLKNYISHANFSELCGHRIAHWHSIDFSKFPDKQTIVFLHGFPSAAWDWHLLWKQLAKNYRLVSLDMLGFGLSVKPKYHTYSLLEQANILEALLAEKGVTKYHLMAHDYGDSVAQELLYRQETSTCGAEISSICFLNGGLFPSVHRPMVTQRLLKGRYGSLTSRFMSKGSLKRSFNKIFGQNTPITPESVDILWQLLKNNRGKAVLPKLLSYLDDRKTFGKVWIESMITTKTPLYFINGVQDPISGQHMLDHYIDIIPCPKTTSLDVGHYPHLEAPEKVVNLYLNFLNEVAGDL